MNMNECINEIIQKKRRKASSKSEKGGRRVCFGGEKEIQARESINQKRHWVSPAHRTCLEFRPKCFDYLSRLMPKVFSLTRMPSFSSLPFFLFLLSFPYVLLEIFFKTSLIHSRSSAFSFFFGVCIGGAIRRGEEKEGGRGIGNEERRKGRALPF